MRARQIILGLAAMAGLALANSASAQNTPQFFGGGVTAYDPEISTVQSGALLDAQVVVSDDRKYVTINTQVQDSNLLALHNFEVATGPVTMGGGFVGALNPTGGTTGGTSGSGGGGGGSGAGSGPGAGSPGGGGAGAVSPGVAKSAAAPAGGLSPTNSPEELNRRGMAARSILNRRGMFLLAHS